MHAPGPYGRRMSASADDVNDALLDAVDAGMAALLTYARDVERIARPDSEDVAELLDAAEWRLDAVTRDRCEDLFFAIEQIRGQLAVGAARLAVAA